MPAEIALVESRFVLGTRIDATTYADAVARILAWVRETAPGFVCAANVHLVMEAHDHADYGAMVNQSLLTTPDGMPLRWFLGMLGSPLPDRVYGPILAMRTLAAAADAGIPVGLFGGRDEQMPVLVKRLTDLHPTLRIAYALAPPFRPLDKEEQAQVMSDLAASGARILLVGLGCPKQERWMAEHYRQFAGVMMGVGAFFDFASGRVRQAPQWMQRAGLEWCYRLFQEPRRLCWRYAWNNPRFVMLALLQLMRLRGRR
jgi:N-acetylglucosaminyldiphosphoundecaprenol N-acetyl-beta-D-mannosaminyltransferase